MYVVEYNIHVLLYVSDELRSHDFFTTFWSRQIGWIQNLGWLYM